jgi:sulfate/thiosulfate transport system permease protein
MSRTNRHVLPGFSLSLGYTMMYLSFLALLPLAACFSKAFSLSAAQFWGAVWTPRTIAAYRFTLEVSLLSSVASIFLGFLIAWVLVRYEFPFKRVFDALIDLPFALPTAVAGLVYSGLYVENGWLGQFLVPLGIHAVYSRLAVVVVLTFLGIPFVVRTLQPVLESMEDDKEEAAYLLGASRGQTFWRVIFPTLIPALITGFSLSLARGMGEYGSVVFVSGNMPFKTEIAAVLIVARLEEFAYAEATAIAVVLLVISFAMLVLINLLEAWSKRFYA